MGLIEPRGFCKVKETANKAMRLPTDWGNIFAHYTPRGINIQDLQITSKIQQKQTKQLC